MLKLLIIASVPFSIVFASISSAATLSQELTVTHRGVAPLPGSDFTFADPGIDVAPVGGSFLEFLTPTTLGNSYDFGTITGNGIARRFPLVKNTGTADAFVSSIYYSDGTVGFSLGPEFASPIPYCGGFLAASATCQISTQWNLSILEPTGNYNDFLAIEYSDFNVVPLPASGFLLIGALGMLGLKRMRGRAAGVRKALS